MAHDSMTGTDAIDSTADFAAHLQRRLGISRLELGECLTHYRPARSYQIVLGAEPSGREGGSGLGFAAE